MKVSDLFPSKYATGADLNGRPVTLTISHVRAETMNPPGSAPVEKWVIYFDGAKKGIVLSRTLAMQIAKAVGTDDVSLWTGKPVTLYPETIRVAGQEKIAIRAKSPEGR